MNVIEMTRKLGAAIQQDERFIRYAKARLANDNDENLQNAIGEFNTIRMQLDSEVNAENRDEEKISALNEKLRTVYGQVMSAEAMVEYNTSKAAVDQMLNEINGIIGLCVDGEDPATCEVHDHSCGGGCDSCAGCH